MVDFTKGLPDYFEDEDHCELADKTWDQIDHLLDALVQNTACTNEAIRYLLGAVAKGWPDPADRFAFEARRLKKQQGGTNG
jgi:hypothetical protein